MNVYGDRTYASRLDSEKLRTFLHQRGMSQQDIDSLIIQFVSRISHFHSAVGTYSAKDHRILIATRHCSLLEMNETLMHEIQHAMDRKKFQARIHFEYAVAGFAITGLALRLLLPWGAWYWLGCVVAAILIERILWAARTLYFERRAKKFERQYGRTCIVLH